MEIGYRTKKLENQFLKETKGRAAWGSLFLKIVQRHNELKAASTLDDLYKLPAAKCEKLSGDRAGEYSVKLNKNFRLIFEPAGEEGELYTDGVIDPKKVTRVTILEAKVDYH